MIIPVLKAIIENELHLTFGNGRKPNANLITSGTFVWVYPVVELDKVGAGIGTTYDCVIGFCIPGEVDPGTEAEQAYIDTARGYCLDFENKLSRNDFVKELNNIKREPFYGFLAEHLYGINIRLNVVSRYPYARCP